MNERKPKQPKIFPFRVSYLAEQNENGDLGLYMMLMKSEISPLMCEHFCTPPQQGFSLMPLALTAVTGTLLPAASSG